jgi:DNA-binding XRE family transcriptional regulator
MGIYYVENNRKNTRPATAKAIADALGVTMNEIFDMAER